MIAWALDAAPGAAAAAELAEACARAAAAGRPVCLLAPAPRGAGRAAVERAAALAYLRAHGAALVHDVDAWLEAAVLLVRFGLPEGPRAAVVAPPGSWLEAQALAVVAEAELPAPARRSPRPTIPPIPPTRCSTTRRSARRRAASAACSSPSSRAASWPATRPPAAWAPVAGGGVALYGARAAITAVAILGRAAERMAVGLGPAPRAASAELAIDADRLHRQLDKLGTETRLGDHETKVLLAAYGVPITRQAVAVTPSAAVKLARRAGYPVEVKPWGHDLPTEPAGCPSSAASRATRSSARPSRACSPPPAAPPRAPPSSSARPRPPAATSPPRCSACRRSAGPSSSTRPAAPRSPPRPPRCAWSTPRPSPPRSCASRAGEPGPWIAPAWPTSSAAPRTSSSISTLASPPSSYRASSSAAAAPAPRRRRPHRPGLKPQPKSYDGFKR